MQLSKITMESLLKDSAVGYASLWKLLKETTLEHINRRLCLAKLTSVLRSQQLLEPELLKTARFPSILWVLGTFSRIS
jgi:hypothetical protein